MAYPILAPNSTWYKSSTARNTITQINIVNSYTPTGSENESWNADVGNTGSIKCYRTGTVVTMAGNGSGKIAMNADSSFVFCSYSGSAGAFTALTSISGATLLDSSNATTFYGLFYGCQKLTSVDVSNWDTGKVTDMRSVFQQATAIDIIDVSKWDTSSCTNMSYMFAYAISIKTLDLSRWNVSKVITMKSMFTGHQTVGDMSLEHLDVSGWMPSSCTDMSFMFNRCTSLTSLDVSKWDVSKVTNMHAMFQQSSYGTTAAPLTELDVSNWDTSSCTDMGWMFYGLRNVKTLDVSRWDVSKVTSLHHFAAHAYIELIGVENWDVSSCRAFNATFYSCQNTSLDLSGWDVSKGVTFAQMFEGSGSLAEIKGLENWNTSNGRSFEEMFLNCPSLKKLDLSSFDTRNASSSYTDEWNSDTGSMNNMFTNMTSLEKITLGVNFSFNGDGTATPAVLPTPDATYISGADGNWYDSTGAAYSVSTITVPNTYYAVKPFALGNISKVEYFGKVLIDLTGDSVTPETLGKGVTAHDKTGAPIVGTMESGGGAPVEEKDVNFYDYDGTLLYSYTIEEAQALTELPQLPDRSNEGLTCQRWNWTLSEVNEIESESIGADIGALYIPADGKTHYYIELLNPSIDVTLNFTGTVTVEWGDGSTSASVTSPASHRYAKAGSYEIKMSGGSYAVGGGTTGTPAVVPVNLLDKAYLATGGNNYCFYTTTIKYITIPSGSAMGNYCFEQALIRCLILSNVFAIGLNGAYMAPSLTTVCLPCYFWIQNMTFRGCYALRRMAFGKTSKITESYKFYQTNSLEEIYYPDTAIGVSDLFQSKVKKIVISSRVTNIGSNAFDSCGYLKIIKFYPTTPPTVANTAAFNCVPTTCVVEVPKGTLATYQAATNYSGIAAQMVESES